MRTLYDESGAAVEVPDSSELEALTAAQAEAERLKEEIKTLSDNSPEGLRQLRSALGRKEEQIVKLQGELSNKPSSDLETVSKTATEAARRVLVDAEVSRATANLSTDDKASFGKYFSKISAGEDVNLETVHSFIQDAERAAGLSVTRSAPLRSGKGPRTDDKPKSFADTEEGQSLAARLNLVTEPPKKS